MDDKIVEKKLKAFAFGSKDKVSKKDLLNKRKKQEDEEAAREFEKFMQTFQQPQSKVSKSWIKAGTYDAGARREDTAEKGKLYKPLPRVGTSSSLIEQAEEIAKIMPVKKEKDNRKSNLEMFKDELKQMQEERKERYKIKNFLADSMGGDRDTSVFISGDLVSENDPNTTNLFLPNINPELTENQLMEMFGKYGPLASVKIMWPRTKEEKARGKNCGFVAFMNRKDAERALKKLSGKDIMGFTMKMCWSKVVPITSQPIYVPPSLQKLLLPPPLSGLPFNAQTDNRTLRQLNIHDNDAVEKILPKTIVKVVAPTDRLTISLIHRMVEFAVREGPLFEAIIMNKEINNPMFSFLFNNKSPLHVYYRWKLFSVLQGDSVKDWRMDEFRMFKGGSVWQPPPKNVYTRGMPENLFSDDDSDDDPMRELSTAQRDRFEELLRNITVKQDKIAEALIFCVEHYQAVEEIVECITQSLSSETTNIQKKIARMYIISDVLHRALDRNEPSKIYLNAFRSKIEEIFDYLHLYKENLDDVDKILFNFRVLRILDAWDQWKVFPAELLTKIRRKITGIVEEVKSESEEEEEPEDTDPSAIPIPEEDNLQIMKQSPESPGVTTPKAPPVADDEEDVDGIPLSPNPDLDGEPMTPSPPRVSTEAMESSSKGFFVPSRWETLDPDLVEQQAMTTSKWEQFYEQDDKQEEEKENKDSFSDSDEETPRKEKRSKKGETEESTNRKQAKTPSSESMKGTDDEYRRKQLREIELKVIKYQDELESGDKKLKCGWNMTQQIHHYRKSLMKKLNNSMSSNQSSSSDKHRHSDRHSDSDDDRYDLSKLSRSEHKDREKSYDREKPRDKDRDKDYKERDKDRSKRSSHKRRAESLDSSDDEGSQSSSHHHSRSVKKSRHDRSDKSPGSSRHDRSDRSPGSSRHDRSERRDRSPTSSEPLRYRSPSPIVVSHSSKKSKKSRNSSRNRK